MKYKAQLDTGDYHEISENISRIIMYNKGKKINLKMHAEKPLSLYRAKNYEE